MTAYTAQGVCKMKVKVTIALIVWALSWASGLLLCSSIGYLQPNHKAEYAIMLMHRVELALLLKVDP
jgi:hypothetical protein